MHSGASVGELPTTVARMLGFKSPSAQMRSIVDAQVRRLVVAGILTDANGFLRRASGSVESTPPSQ